MYVLTLTGFALFIFRCKLMSDFRRWACGEVETGNYKIKKQRHAPCAGGNISEVRNKLKAKNRRRAIYARRRW